MTDPTIVFFLVVLAVTLASVIVCRARRAARKARERQARSVHTHRWVNHHVTLGSKALMYQECLDCGERRLGA